jgi:cell division protein FtsX
MAISRAQALKELLPGLNALFGLSTKSTTTSMRISMKQNHQSVALRRKLNYPDLAQPQ